jgi:Flp pilus assembly protein TadB
MVPIAALWLPILVSAVIVFVVSSIIHMMLGYHAADHRKAGAEGELLDAMRRLAVTPGDYILPCAPDRATRQSPEFLERYRQGPVVLMTVMPGGAGMGRMFVLWFLFAIAVGVFAAYIAGRALGPGAHYLEVFRFVGATAFIGYAVANWQNSIWYGRSWGTTARNTLDALIYGTLTAGTFGWLWPR